MALAPSVTKVNRMIEEFTSALERFKEICDYEIDLHESGLKP
jgi:hypothetical protein